MTITLHAAQVWVFLGKFALTVVIGYILLAFTVLSTMDSGWWWLWVPFMALIGALVYGVWFA